MDIAGKITGIKYTIFLSDDLKQIDIKSFDINDVPATCLLNYSATKSALYGKNGNLHKAFDHEKFADTMKNCKHKWLITYDDCKYIRELFSFANIIPWDLTYGMRNVTGTSDQKGKELFISNYLTEIPQSKQLLFAYDEIE